MQPQSTTRLPLHAKDIAGQRFGRLLAISFSHLNKHSNAIWNCICDCGNYHQAKTADLISGATTSCGCRQKEMHAARRTRNGLSSHPLYQVYRGMISRCYDPSCEQYPRYGERGITVCARWLDSFDNFIADVGPKPSPEYSLDRIDNNLGYSPDNVRWATSFEQMNNTRANHPLTYNNQTFTITQWSRIVGIASQTIAKRLKAGWTVERALSEPISPRLAQRRRRGPRHPNT